MPRWLKTLLSYLLPVRVAGDDQVGYSARCFGDRNAVWSAKRETALFGAKERRAGR